MVGTALILLDLQHGILGMMGSSEKSEALLDLASTALAAARAKPEEYLIVHVGVRFRPGHPEIAPHSPQGFVGAKANNRLVEGTEPANHPAKVAPQAGEVTVSKRRVGAFTTTDLDLILRSNGVRKVVLGGIATSGAVLSTVREAADRDYGIVVLRDLCADHDEEVHRVLLDKVFSKQGEVITTEQFVASLK